MTNSIDFTFIRRCLALNNWDELDAYSAIKDEIEKRKKKTFSSFLKNLEEFGEEFFIFGLDFSNVVTIGIQMNLFNKIGYKKLYVYIYVIVNLMMNELIKNLEIDYKLNFMVDFCAADFTMDPINELITMNKGSFPGFLKNVYVVNSEEDDVKNHIGLQDTWQDRRFYPRKLQEQVYVFKNDFEPDLFKEIQKSTVNEMYGGDLEDNMFDINPLVYEYAQNLEKLIIL